MCTYVHCCTETLHGWTCVPRRGTCSVGVLECVLRSTALAYWNVSAAKCALIVLTLQRDDTWATVRCAFAFEQEEGGLPGYRWLRV